MKGQQSQSIHGGRIREAALRHNLSRESILDFSSNLNVFMPEIPAECWSRWRSEVGLYPEADGGEIAKKMSPVLGVEAGTILPTSGGIEAIYLAARLFSNKRVVVLEPAFSDYARAFEAAGAEVIRVVSSPVERAPEFDDSIESAEVVVFGNPNNPTGRSYAGAELLSWIQRPWKVPKSWVVDEAFIEFSEKPVETTLLPVLDKNPNFIVVGSFTKSWRIPGLRLGYLGTANEDWRRALEGMQPPWSINAVAQAWAREMLNPEAAKKVRDSLGKMAGLRKSFQRKLESGTPFRAVDSDANFFLAEYRRDDGKLPGIIGSLEKEGILVRSCNSFDGMPKDRWIRLAVRQGEENQRLVEVLKKV